MKTRLLFVFGTLRRGHRNHHYIAGTFARMLPARLAGFGRQSPLMIARRDGDVVDGEVYFIRPDAWDRTIRGCDDLEGIAPGADVGSDYRRIRVSVDTPEGPVVAWAYVSPETQPDLQPQSS